MAQVTTSDDHSGLANLQESENEKAKVPECTWIAQWSQSGGLKWNPSTLESPSTVRSSVVFGEKKPPVRSSCFPNTVLVWLYLQPC